jgi:hypothetical protein
MQDAVAIGMPPRRQRRLYHRTGLYGRGISPEEREAADTLRAALIAHCGGEDAISTPRRVLVDLATAAAIRAQRVNAYLAEMGSLVDKRAHSEWKVVNDARRAERHLLHLLIAIGLEPHAKPVKDIRQLCGFDD